jgi:hypothetical protein
VPELGWTTQKIFHLMNFLVNGGNNKKLLASHLLLIGFGFHPTPSVQFIVISTNRPNPSSPAVRALVFGFHVHVFLLRTKVRNHSPSFFAYNFTFSFAFIYGMNMDALCSSCT